MNKYLKNIVKNVEILNLKTGILSHMLISWPENMSLTSWENGTMPLILSDMAAIIDRIRDKMKNPQKYKNEAHGSNLQGSDGQDKS